MNDDGVLGGIHLPSDGSVNPTDLTQALAKGARMNGATIRENISFKEVLTKNGEIIGVSTEQGIISTDTVVNCGSMWAQELGQQNVVSIPIHACEHYYLVAQPIPNLPSNLPVLRSHYDGTYWKQDTGKLLFRFDHFKARAGIPENFDFDSLPFVEEDMMEVLEMSMNHVPVFQENGIQTFFNGPESYSHDGRFNLGESPNLKGYFLLAGVNSTAIQSGSGAEKALADWIMTGHPPMDSAEMDSARIEDWQARDIYWQEHCPQTLVLTYAMQWPRRQREKARNLRRTPFYHAMKAHGAVYDEVQGWECPAWFAPEVVFPESDYSFYRPSWFNYVQEEQKTVRGSVGIIDYSMLQKLLVSGRDAENFL